MFPAFLHTLAPLLGFATLAPDAHGACLLKIKEGEFSLLFEWDEQIVPRSVLLSSPLFSFPPEKGHALALFSLQRNLSLEETLSLHPEKNLLLLHRRLSPEVDQPELERLLNLFLKTSTLLKQEISRL